MPLNAKVTKCDPCQVSFRSGITARGAQLRVARGCPSGKTIPVDCSARTMCRQNQVGYNRHPVTWHSTPAPQQNHIYVIPTERLLLRAIGLCPCYKNLGNGVAQLVTGNKIHWIVNARPNSRIAAFFSNRTNEIRVCWEEVCKHF